MHPAEVECIGKGKARQPYEFGVKVSLAITERHGVIVGAWAFPGNPYDGHVLAEQLEQTSILLQEVQGEPRVKTVLGYRGVDADVTPVQLVHRGKSKTLWNRQRRWLKRRQGFTGESSVYRRTLVLVTMARPRSTSTSLMRRCPPNYSLRS